MTETEEDRQKRWAEIINRLSDDLGDTVKYVHFDENGNVLFIKTEEEYKTDPDWWMRNTTVNTVYSTTGMWGPSSGIHTSGVWRVGQDGLRFSAFPTAGASGILQVTGYWSYVRVDARKTPEHPEGDDEDDWDPLDGYDEDDWDALDGYDEDDLK